MTQKSPIDLVVGCKILRDDYTSLYPCSKGRITYSGKWTRVPGNGAYVAVTDGLPSGGPGTVLVYLECREPTGASAPKGVVCYRWVRIVDPCPQRISPALRAEVACYAPGLSPEERVKLAMRSTCRGRGVAARYLKGLTAEQRVALAMKSNHLWRAIVARQAPGLSAEQRFGLAMHSTPGWRGSVAYYAYHLSPEQRFRLAMRSTTKWRGRIACYSSDLSSEQRYKLALKSTPKWRKQVARYAPGLAPNQRFVLTMAGKTKSGAARTHSVVPKE